MRDWRLHSGILPQHYVRSQPRELNLNHSNSYCVHTAHSKRTENCKNKLALTIKQMYKLSLHLFLVFVRKSTLLRDLFKETSVQKTVTVAPEFVTLALMRINYCNVLVFVTSKCKELKIVSLL
jgi:hypothetical protein